MCSISGNKSTKARNWSIPIVNHTWLEDCFIQWRNLTVGLEKYIVFPPGIDFSQMLGERGVGRAVLEDVDLEQAENMDEGVAADDIRSLADAGRTLRATNTSARDEKEVEDVVGLFNNDEHPFAVPGDDGRTDKPRVNNEEARQKANPKSMSPSKPVSSGRRRQVEPITDEHTVRYRNKSSPKRVPSVVIKSPSTRKVASSPMRTESMRIAAAEIPTSKRGKPAAEIVSTPQERGIGSPRRAPSTLVRTPSKRSAATKANQKLHDELMPVEERVLKKRKVSVGQRKEAIATDESDDDHRRPMSKRKRAISLDERSTDEDDENDGPKKQLRNSTSASKRTGETRLVFNFRHFRFNSPQSRNGETNIVSKSVKLMTTQVTLNDDVIKVGFDPLIRGDMLDSCRL
jgi:hypothetical protein